MSKLTLNTTLKLLSGLEIPQLGFGVFLSTAAETSVGAALSAGYRHIDSARYYHNEAETAKAAAAWKAAGNTDPVWITTKVQSGEHAPGVCEKAVEESIARAAASGLKWDLLLLHDPLAGPEKRLSAYRVLLDAQKEGKIRSVGVSNFGVRHLEQLAEAGLPAPDINQVELHPWCQQREIVSYCQSKGIVVQAYCPLIRGQKFEDPTLAGVAKEVGKSAAQVLVRWSLQKGFVPLPKSDTPSRIEGNANLYDFELSEAQMARLDGLDEGKKGAISWNPVDCE